MTVQTTNPLEALLGGVTDNRRDLLKLKRRIGKKYIATARDELVENGILSLIEDLIAAKEQTRDEARILAVVGHPGSGKSWTVERALNRRFANAPSLLLRIEAPSPCTLKQLGRSILRALNYEIAKDQLEHITWELVFKQLPLAGVQFLWIDEMHHVLTTTKKEELDKISETLKSLCLLRDGPVAPIVSGLELVSTFIGRDRQIERRSSTIKFSQLRYPEDTEYIRKLVKTVIEEHAGMKADHLLTDEFIHRLCVGTEGSFGTIISMTREAIYHAFVRSKFDGRILLSDYAAAYVKERACEPHQNVFTANDWESIVPSNSRFPDGQPIEEEAPKKRKKGGK